MSDIELVDRVALVIPRPNEVADVYGLCQTIEARIGEIEDIGMLKDAQAKLSAIAEYVGRTSKDGVAQLQATMRRLEARAGEVMGMATIGAHHSVAAEGAELLTRHERTEFRAMAEHKDVVEQVIAESDDQHPPSRKKIMGAIAVEKLRKATADDDLSPQSREAVARRVQKAKEMAESGYSSPQIAEALGMKASSMSEFRSRHGVEVPADALVGGTKRFNSNTIVGGIVTTVDGIGMMLGQVDYRSLDITELEHWVSVLDDSIRSLTTLRKNLKELTQ